MRAYSELFHCFYEMEDCILIPNMKQNFKYLNSGKVGDLLMDIICGSDGRLVFVWQKAPALKELYLLWCDRQL
ncbi:hypothetical protein [Hominifimenecus sp. rT4P-3]|uniref:hypothetical protein n=1 Tax=Hominifimenecus sp. rT4P-3 TaxID=3242979 RepID=UPI003DA4D1FB